MSGTTPRLGLPYPGLTDGPDGADVPYWVQALAEAVDNAALYSEGILASRPTSTAGVPGIEGRFYYVIGDATPANNGILWLDYGTGWVAVNSAGTVIGLLADQPAASSVPSGTRYFATDQVAEYLGDGTGWTRVSTPAGVTSLCLSAAADEGHILLQGQAWPATDGIYADLHDKFGGTVLPDFRQYVPVGYKAGDADFGALGATGGEKKHLLVIGEIPAHTHLQDSRTFIDHIVGSGALSQGAAPTQFDMGGTTGSAGGGLSHNNLQPFRVVNFQAKL